MFEIQWIIDGRWRLIFITEDVADAQYQLVTMRQIFPHHSFRMIDLYPGM